jgi:hypothetical protein
MVWKGSPNMSNLSPIQLALTVAAVVWPLAAGLGLVLWSKSRAARRAQKLAALETELRGLYRAVEGRGAPPHLAMIVDALEEGEAMASARRTEPAKPVTTA